jgi:hypothetical protein
MPQATHGTTLLAISYSNSNGYVTINFTNTASYSTYYGLTCNDTIREIPGSVVSATAGVNYISTYFNFNDNLYTSNLTCTGGSNLPAAGTSLFYINTVNCYTGVTFYTASYGTGPINCAGYTTAGASLAYSSYTVSTAGSNALTASIVPPSGLPFFPHPLLGYANTSACPVNLPLYPGYPIGLYAVSGTLKCGGSGKK